MKENKRKDLFEQILKKSNKRDRGLNEKIDKREILFDKTEKTSEKENNVTKIEITLDLSETAQIIQWQLERITEQEIPLKTIKTIIQFAFKEASEIYLKDNDG